MLIAPVTPAARPRQQEEVLENFRSCVYNHPAIRWRRASFQPQKGISLTCTKGRHFFFKLGIGQSAKEAAATVLSEADFGEYESLLALLERNKEIELLQGV